MDIRPLLADIRARTLVLHAAGDRLVPSANGRQVAHGIAGARFVPLDSSDHFPHDNVAQVAGLIREFLTGQSPPEHEQRRLATIVFTDVVGSTLAAAKLGNQRWADLLASMHRGWSEQVRDHGGVVVDTAGDGMLCMFEGPRQAIRCAESMLRFVRTLDLDARVGVHAGEVEIRGEHVMGLAVHTAARIADVARADEIVASRTIKDLLAGSALSFAARGVHALKGVPDRWELYAVREAP